MFHRRRRGPWPPPPPEEHIFTRIRPIINHVVEIVSGGIIRAGKTAYGSGTGWWLGIDPADDEPKFDIGTPTNYLRYSVTDGVLIKADGSALTNIAGANITCANLAVISAQTGALTVDDVLTMGEEGVITWMSGAAKITDDYMDVALTNTDRYAFRFLDGEAVHAYLAAYKSPNLTQVSIEVVGPAEDKYATFAVAAIEFIDEDPETTDFILRSDTGVAFSALNYLNTRIFKVDTMDVHLTNKVRIGTSAAPTYDLEIVHANGPRLFLQHTTNNVRFTAHAALTQARIGTLSDHAVRFLQNNVVCMVLDTNQRLGLGTGALDPTAKLDVDGDTIRLRTAKTPASAGAAGNAGDIAGDANYFYRCVATNTWKRVAILTW